MASELLNLLCYSTLMLSVALAGVLLLRRPWLRWFGAHNAFLLWLSVPATLLVLLLPAPVRRIEGAAIQPLGEMPEAAPMAAPVMLPEPAFALDTSSLLIAIWLIGAVLMAAWLVSSQRRLLRSLGRLAERPDGSFLSASDAAGPAVVGAFRPRIVLPADFDRRYSPQQQSLILEHERCHLRRGDAQFTLLACFMRTMFWFNPLVHVAWPRFRIDQELACDAAVVRRYPGLRREYAEAMLFTQFSSTQPPVGCTWLTGHPLKRRITMLYAHPVGKTRLLIGTLLAVAAGSAAAAGAWSAQEPQRLYTSTHLPKLELAVAVPGQAQRMASMTGGSAALTAVGVPFPDVAIAPPPAAVAAAGDADESRSAPRLPVAAASAPGASATDTPSGPENSVMVDVQPAELVKADRPSFPRSRSKPRLVGYPGMPDAERPGPEWMPEHGLWELKVRVTLDEGGQLVDASIADNQLNDVGLVRRYERLALSAVRGWQYAPARIDGEPVPSEMLMSFYFDTRLGQVGLNDFGTSPHDRPIGRTYEATRRATNR